jgi:hypothetical protein
MVTKNKNKKEEVTNANRDDARSAAQEALINVKRAEQFGQPVTPEEVKRLRELNEQRAKEGTAPANIQSIKAGDALREDPSRIGLETPDTTPADVGIETITTPVEQEQEKRGLLETFLKGPLDPSGQELITGEPLIAPVSALPSAWNIGGKIFANGDKAAKVATATSNTAKVVPLASKIRDFAIGGYAALKTGEGLIGYFSGRKIDEQQAAINTLGAMATTIGGDSTEGTGDWRKGLSELQNIKGTILELESSIKAGTIQSAVLKFDGKIYDINADMSDQLATIDEQIKIIQSFAAAGQFPELSELELQNILRELEGEGIVKPVDLTTSRRNPNEA